MHDSRLAQASSSLSTIAAEELGLQLLSFEEARQVSDNLQRAICMVHKYQNAFLLVNKLPTELLGLIFQFVVAPMIDVFQVPSAQVHQAMTIATVCTWWRKIAVNNPNLWYHITDADVIRPINPATVLHFSGTTPLHVHTELSSDSQSSVARDILTKKPDRVQALHLHLNDDFKFPDAFGPSAEFPPLPMLELLTVQAVYDTEEDDDVSYYQHTGLPPIFGGETPSLKALYLSYHIPFVPGNQFPVLTHLRLSRLPSRVLTVNKVLRLLSNSPQLVTVQLDDSLVDYVGGRVDPDLCAIVLNRLEYLWIDFVHVTPAFAIVSRLEFPPEVNVRLSHLVTFPSAGDDDEGEDFPPPIVIALTPSLRRITGLTHVDILEWARSHNGNDGDDTAEGEGGDDRRADFHLIACGVDSRSGLWIHITTDEYTHSSPESAILPEIYAMLPTQDLRKIRASVDDPARLAGVTAMVEGAPSLSTLEVRAGHAHTPYEPDIKDGLEGLVNALRPLSSPDSDDSSEEHVRAPDLKDVNLYMNGVSNSHDLFVDMLEERARCGNPLQSLSTTIPRSRAESKAAFRERVANGEEGDVDPWMLGSYHLWEGWESNLGIPCVFMEARNEYWSLWNQRVSKSHPRYGLPEDY